MQSGFSTLLGRGLQSLGRGLLTTPQPPTAGLHEVPGDLRSGQGAWSGDHAPAWCRPVSRDSSKGIAPGFLALALAVVALTAETSRASTPADELLRYIPADAAFCFVARDLRGHGQALADSPFVAGLRKTPVGEAIVHSDELSRLSKAQDQLQKQLGLDWDKLRNDIFGDGVAFAYWPGPPDKPEQEIGLILIRARDPKPLAELVARINEAQKASGEVKEIEQRAHGDLTYFCRVERDKPPTYYCLRGPVLLLTGKEALLLQALDLERSTTPETESALAREFRLLGAARSVLALWINPRAFDARVEERAQSTAPEAAGMRTFHRYWKALDGVAIALDLDKDVSVSVSLRGRSEQFPPAARRLFSKAAQASDLWQAFPEAVLVAAAGRLDAAALVEVINEFLPADGRPAVAGELNRALGPPLGKDFVKEVLPCVGPDMGFCLYAPPAADANWCPQGFAALKVAAGDPAAPVDRALLAGLHTVAMLAVVAHNAKDADHPLTLKSETRDKREVKYLTGEGVFPPGLQPAFGLHSGYLVVATSPATLHRFAPAPPPPAQPGEALPLLRVGLKEWREYLKARLEPLTATLAEKDGLKPEVVRGRLEAVSGTLELFDRLEVTQRVASGRVAVTIRLQPNLPLKK